MIRSRDVNKEIRAIEATLKEVSGTDDLLRALLKVSTLTLKVVRDMKTNQVLGLKKAGVELIKERRDAPDAKDETKKAEK